MAFRASARINRLVRARKQSVARIEQSLAASLRAGWRGLKPKLDRLGKADGLDSWFDEWADEFEAAFTAALASGAAPIADAEGQSWRGYPGGDGLDLDPSLIAERYYARLGEAITGNPAQTTLEHVRAAIQRWRENQAMGLDTLAESLGFWFSGDRARLIAINETTRLVSFTTRDVMGQLELERWTWQTRLEWNTCEQCRSLHGREFGIDDAMPPDGSHIGCVLPGQIVAVPGLVAGAKSFYRGRVIEITTVDGRQLTVTPNHPVLTPRGWVSAELIGEGNQVISHRRAERMAFSIYPDCDHRPTQIEQVFSALAMTRGMIAVTMPASPKDFHGDGRSLDGNINVVRPDRELLFNGQAYGCQHLRQLGFDRHSISLGSVVGEGVFDLFGLGEFSPARRFIGPTSHGLAFCDGQAGMSEALRLCDPATRDTVLGQDARDDVAADAMLFGERQFGLTGNVGIANDLFRQDNSGVTPNGEIGLLENAPESRFANSVMRSDFWERERPFVHPISVAQMRELDFAGHVYDLQSLNGLYTCNGIFVHNCYCFPAPKVRG